MSGHLCLKWNNHSPAFLKSISEVQSKEKYCDATIACQGKYFPVHRIVLSTCSEYFEEMFERIQNPHPYIVFKDIDPAEMVLLLNYMYQGEINVVQEKLPVLIKAAEALKIKGLAVPDDPPSRSESLSSRKRGSSSVDTPPSKRRSEEKRRRRNSSDHFLQLNSSGTEELSENVSNSNIERVGGKLGSDFVADGSLEQSKIKVEPVDSGEYAENFLGSNMREEQSGAKGESSYGNFNVAEPSTVHVKTEDRLEPENSVEPFIEQPTEWGDFPSGNLIQSLLPSEEMGRPEDMSQMIKRHRSVNEEQINQLNCARFLFECMNDDHGTEEEETSLASTSDIGKGSMCSSDYPEPATSKRKTLTLPESLKCVYCDHTEFGARLDVSMHNHIIQTHPCEKPFVCLFCSKPFITNSDLKRHVRVHTGEKPFQCSLCSKWFSQRSSMERHKKYSHKEVRY